ncbi:21694_t:CDS:2 [Dentiscutata erythropus]|uniref:21694_t:CDS:1 n=1 Tax=Dentiscutata erythropus TaxID=1348616 RepID=A0A9N8VZK9_9GLOM|nr:21694_t:CDS:2 [Dentiscutata erythropus]
MPRDSLVNRAKRFVATFSCKLSYEELLQWATQMKSEDINHRTSGEQKLYTVWRETYPNDTSPPAHMWDLLKRGLDLYKHVELNAHDERLVDFINICYDIEKFREQWQPRQVSTSSVRPSRRVKPISLGKRIQDLTLPNTVLQTNCPNEELNFFKKIAENKMAKFSLNLWVKNVFSAIPKHQHFAHLYLILTWNEAYTRHTDHNGFIHLLNGMRHYVKEVPKPYGIKIKTLIKILRKLEEIQYYFV